MLRYFQFREEALYRYMCLRFWNGQSFSLLMQNKYNVSLQWGHTLLLLLVCLACILLPFLMVGSTLCLYCNSHMMTGGSGRLKHTAPPVQTFCLVSKSSSTCICQLYYEKMLSIHKCFFLFFHSTLYNINIYTIINILNIYNLSPSIYDKYIHT